MRIFRLGLAALLAIVSPFVTAVQAQTPDRPQTILVLDASGSMWGQIDGTAKITIAQDVVTDLLATFPADVSLGLTVYGHREKGNCADIETVVAPAPGTAATIAAAVRGIQPRGKTPMTDAVIAAAQALKYTEERATVILVSDGIETCNPDPCAAALALEAAGVDFTAHVIGFDVEGDPTAQAQLQCIAANTGGRYIAASNALELTEALFTVVAVEPEPEPVPVDVIFVGTIGQSGPQIDTNLIWEITGGTRETGAPTIAPTVTEQLLPGMYRASATRPEDELTVELDFEAYTNGQTVALVFPEYLPKATLQAPASAAAGSTIDIGWTGPGVARDYVSAAAPDTPETQYVNYTYIEEGNPLRVVMPTRPGPYELRYVDSTANRALVKVAITVTPVEATLEAPAAAPAGSNLQIGWTGPDYERDYVSVAAVGERDGAYINYTYTRDGTPLTLPMPPTPGDYELRYVLGQDNTALVRQPITLTAVEAKLEAPAEAPAGSNLQIGWTGPDYERDYISVAAVGERDGAYINYTYTRDGAPLTLLMPAAPGDYELRYVVGQDDTVMARQPITVTAVEATLAAPAEAAAGATVQIGWTGPGYERDFVSVASAGERDGAYISYTYVRDGNPLSLPMPPLPGTYELRYVLDQDATVLIRQTVTITPVTATIEAPATAAKGTEVQIGWTGPAYARDYVAIAKVGERDEAYEFYTYVNEGSPLRLQMPEAPGTYELRYVMEQDATVLMRKPITVE